MRYDWPGNVGELANVLERAQILAEQDEITLDEVDKAGGDSRYDPMGALYGLLERETATQFRDEKLRALASNPALLATEAADYLVHKGIPFRQAHDLVGKILREAEKQGKNWIDLPLTELQKISPEIGPDFTKSLTVEAALAAKKVPGGTSPDSVRAAIADLEKRIRGIGATK